MAALRAPTAATALLLGPCHLPPQARVARARWQALEQLLRRWHGTPLQLASYRQEPGLHVLLVHSPVLRVPTRICLADSGHVAVQFPESRYAPLSLAPEAGDEQQEFLFQLEEVFWQLYS